MSRLQLEIFAAEETAKLFERDYVNTWDPPDGQDSLTPAAAIIILVLMLIVFHTRGIWSNGGYYQNDNMIETCIPHFTSRFIIVTLWLMHVSDIRALWPIKIQIEADMISRLKVNKEIVWKHWHIYWVYWESINRAALDPTNSVTICFSILDCKHQLRDTKDTRVHCK